MYSLIQALNEIQSSIRLFSFPFLSRPPEQSTYHGITTHPGFHTTTNIDTAATYGLGKVYTQNMDNDVDGIRIVTDYPVVVGLDMSDYEKQLDYDAEILVLNNLETMLKDIVNNIPDESTWDDIYLLIEGYAVEDTMPSIVIDPLDNLSNIQFDHFNNISSALLGLEDPVQAVLNYKETGKVDDALVMSITDQFRYSADVPHTRILAVWYVEPIAEDITDYQADTDSQVLDDITNKWPGFNVVDYDDILNADIRINYTQVWGEDSTTHVEYHGTTYLRLLQSVPEFAHQLPVPPSPPYSP